MPLKGESGIAQISPRNLRRLGRGENRSQVFASRFAPAVAGCLSNLWTRLCRGKPCDSVAPRDAKGAPMACRRPICETAAVTLSSAVEIADSFCRSLDAAAHYDAPYPHCYADGIFPEPVIAALAALPLAAAPAAGSGKREDNASRLFFAGEALDRFPVVRTVADALQSAPVVAEIAARFGADLAGSHLRLEYAIDTEGFWLAPHTDIGVKKFTCLISLAKDDGQLGLGTDIYSPDNRLYKRAPFRRNGALMFVPGDRSWHGFAQRPIPEPRKSVILNYVGAEWRARDQLAFPDTPVRTA
jgi:hypothetical protein